MAYVVSNGHLNDDVTWLWKVKLVTPICSEPENSWRWCLATVTNCQILCCEAVRLALLATAWLLVYYYSTMSNSTSTLRRRWTWCKVQLIAYICNWKLWIRIRYYISVKIVGYCWCACAYSSLQLSTHFERVSAGIRWVQWMESCE